MKIKFISFSLIFISFLIGAKGRESVQNADIVQSIDYVAALKDTLNHLLMSSNNEFFKMHCNSIIKVINSRPNMQVIEADLIKQLYVAFNNEEDTCNPKGLTTYLKRRRPFILAWESPTDHYISLAYLKPPKIWDTGKEYPLYVRLHGLSSVAQSSISYMVNPFITKASNDSSFDDGYLLSPCGRGNGMYINMAETDIWESIDAIEKIAKINPARKYLAGLSMGGYGVWHIALKSSHVWAALGIYAGGLAYNNSKELTLDTVMQLKDVPTYIICGTKDALFPSNQTGYNLLQETGNPNLKFFTFDGEHEFYNEYIENMYLWMRNFNNDDWYISDIENRKAISDHLQILSYPNPFNFNTSIMYYIAGNGHVKIEIYNHIGQLSEILVNETQSVGMHEISWTPGNLPEGIYYCRLITSEVIETIKIIYNK